MHFAQKLQPAIPGSGFRMEGYHVWCGSAIQDEDGRYYLFASRWPRETKFPQGYMNHSEIVMAATDDLSRPFEYVKTIISQRDRRYWDGQMAHNPQILKIGGEYVLFYIGCCDGTAETRAIGYARAKELTGEWIRSDEPLALPKNANNPAVCPAPDGSLMMIFRDGSLHVSAARAERLGQPFEVLKYDLFPETALEDFFLFRRDGQWEMLLEDNRGGLTGQVRFGAHLVSEDCLNWRLCDPAVAYDHTLRYADGTVLQAERRERPQLLLNEAGEAVALFTGVLIDDHTWNFVQPVDRY